MYKCKGLLFNNLIYNDGDGPLSLLHLHDRFESAVGHAFHIKGHFLGIAEVHDPRVLHHFGGDAVAMSARFVDDKRKNDGFT